MGRKLNAKEAAKKAAKVINEIAPKINKICLSDIIKLFTENKIPYYSAIVGYINKKEYTSVDNNGLYTWCKEEPIYYKDIEDIIYRERAKSYKKYTKTKQKALQDTHNAALAITEEDAIAFLKGKGYKIMKPIVEYTEI